MRNFAAAKFVGVAQMRRAIFLQNELICEAPYSSLSRRIINTPEAVFRRTENTYEDVGTRRRLDFPPNMLRSTAI
jgi:hypothetical protein